MKPQQLVLEETMTVAQLMAKHNLNQSMYFAVVDGKMVQGLDTEIKAGTSVRLIPTVKGGMQ